MFHKSKPSVGSPMGVWRFSRDACGANETKGGWKGRKAPCSSKEMYAVACGT